MQLENTLIKNFIDELKVLRIENYSMQQRLRDREDQCDVLQNRLKTMKDKYSGVKLERNKAWQKIKELTRSNQLMDE